MLFLLGIETPGGLNPLGRKHWLVHERLGEDQAARLMLPLDFENRLANAGVADDISNRKIPWMRN